MKIVIVSNGTNPPVTVVKFGEHTSLYLYVNIREWMWRYPMSDDSLQRDWVLPLTECEWKANGESLFWDGAHAAIAPGRRDTAVTNTNYI